MKYAYTWRYYNYYTDCAVGTVHYIIHVCVITHDAIVYMGSFYRVFYCLNIIIHIYDEVRCTATAYYCFKCGEVMSGADRPRVLALFANTGADRYDYAITIL